MEQTTSKSLMMLEKNEYIAAAIQPKYIKIETLKRQAILSTYIAEVYKFRGQIANSADLVDMARDLDRKLSGDEKLSLLTLEEIRVAFLHGVTGEYGEYYGINYVTLSKWVSAYFFSEERLEMIQRYQREKQRIPQNTRLLAQKSNQTTEREREEYLVKTLNAYFDDVRRGRPVVGMAHTQEDVYHYLVKRGILKPSKDDKMSAMSRAEDWLKQHRDSRTRSMIEILDDCYDKSQDKEITEHSKTIRKAKSIILSDWLHSIQTLPEIAPSSAD